MLLRRIQDAACLNKVAGMFTARLGAHKGSGLGISEWFYKRGGVATRPHAYTAIKRTFCSEAMQIIYIGLSA